MASPELQLARGASPDLGANPRLLEDCLRGFEPMDVLKQLSASLLALGDQDREDAALFMGYLAYDLLGEASTTAERTAVIEPVIAGYQTIQGPHLRRMTEWLLSQAYVRKGDLAGVAAQIQRALERELEVGATTHVLGPLLGASFTAPSSSEDPQAASIALGALEQTVERAIPLAIDLGLAALQSDRTPPHELRDALLLLENALFASPYESQPFREAVPRILDALADVDLNRLRESGIALRTLSSLLTQSESRLLMAGALRLEDAPRGGRTTPADLRRRWVMENLDLGTGEWLFNRQHRMHRAPEFR